MDRCFGDIFGEIPSLVCYLRRILKSIGFIPHFLANLISIVILYPGVPQASLSRVNGVVPRCLEKWIGALEIFSVKSRVWYVICVEF